MNQKLKAYLAKRKARPVTGPSIQAYDKAMDDVTVKIVEDICEGNRLASQLRVPEPVTNPATGKDD